MVGWYLLLIIGPLMIVATSLSAMRIALVGWLSTAIMNYIGDPQTARDAVALLQIGPQLFARVNKAAQDRQAREAAENRYSKRPDKAAAMRMSKTATS